MFKKLLKMLKYQVVIIGCGISGLAAASKLIKKGIEDFVIIEAQDYVGGRINSIDYSKKFFKQAC